MFGVMNLENGRCFGIEDQLSEKYYIGYAVIGFSHAIVSKDYINAWQSGYKCEHKGCSKDGSVKCHVPDFEDVAFAGRTYDATGIKVIEHLCPDHAYEAGYCALCGDFWGGIEGFDINNPSHLCEHCQEQIKDENCEEDEEEGGW